MTAPGGSGSINATWTFKNLTPGTYEVWATWIQAPDRATNAPFSVYDNTTLLNTVNVNQTLAPSAYFDGGTSYVTLGQSYNISSGTLVVKLSNSGVPSNAYIVADAIRINRVGNPTGGVVLPFSTAPGEEAMVESNDDGASAISTFGAEAAVARFSPPRRQPERFPVGGLAALFQGRNEPIELLAFAQSQVRDRSNPSARAPRLAFRDNAATNQFMRRRIDQGVLTS